MEVAAGRRRLTIFGGLDKLRNEKDKRSPQRLDKPPIITTPTPPHHTLHESGEAGACYMIDVRMGGGGNGKAEMAKPGKNEQRMGGRTSGGGREDGWVDCWRLATWLMGVMR